MLEVRGRPFQVNSPAMGERMETTVSLDFKEEEGRRD